jgi:hypothetical protein
MKSTPARASFVCSFSPNASTPKCATAAVRPSQKPKLSDAGAYGNPRGFSLSFRESCCLAQEAEIDPLFPPVPSSPPPPLPVPTLRSELTGYLPGSLHDPPLVLILDPDLVSIWSIFIIFETQLLLELSAKSGRLGGRERSVSP